MPALTLPSPVLSSLQGQALASYPSESCGLLLGIRHTDGITIHRDHPAANLELDRPHDRYQLDPQAQLDAELAARAEGLEVVGVWHSHPDRPAAPSETDRAAAWPGLSYMILTVHATSAGAVRSWRLEEDRFLEEAVEVQA